MAEKKDITKLSKVELVEMLQRQGKLLRNRKVFDSLPDKGEKILKLVEKLKEQITMREQTDDLANRFKRISLKSRNATQHVELDSDDDEFCDDDNNDNTMVVDEKGASAAAATQVAVQEESPPNKEKSPKDQLSGKWTYKSAVTVVKSHVFEKAKVLSLEESRELQLKQKEEHEALKAKQAAEKLFEHINRSSSQTGPSYYKFSSMEARMKYREEEEENVQENEEDSESEDKFIYEQEQSDED